MQSGVQDGPPYPSEYQQLGETPSIIPDVPINAVFLFLFILGAIGHAWQYRINILCGRKFIPNAAAFGEYSDETRHQQLQAAFVTRKLTIIVCQLSV